MRRCVTKGRPTCRLRAFPRHGMVCAGTSRAHSLQPKRQGTPMVNPNRSRTSVRSAPLMSVRHPLSRVLAGGLFAVMLAACSSTPPPSAELAAGRAALEGAETSGAREYAGAELEAARNKLAQAEQASSRGDNDLARRLAEAAEADARLAQARASSVRSRNAATQVERSLQALQDELQRKSQ